MAKFKKFVGVAMSALLTVSLMSGTMLTAVAATVAKDGDQNSEAKVEETMNTLSQSAGEQDTQVENQGAYLFVHFIGNEGYNEEQVYFSVSQDGTKWKTLNDVQPILTSDVGEKGIRDPHIIRSPEGNKFYMVATDLCIYNRGGNWSGAQTNGSRGIVVWESDNLIDWTCKGLKIIARENATDTWAPETVWDEERGEYMVFWASITDEQWKYRIYRCYTKDFETFTEPEVYIDGDGSRIDTTFIKEGDTYYRFTKNEDEGAKYVYMEKCKSLNGEWELVNTYSLNGKHYKDEGTAFEGPTVYKLHGEDKWCLLLDSWEYKPFITDDISKGQFVSAGDFDFGGVKFRHGTVMPITQEEYESLLKAYSSEDVTEGELVYQIDFENSHSKATVGEDATSNANAFDYVEGANGSKAIVLNNSKYITLPGSALKGLKSFTISLVVKANGKSWAFYAAPNANEQKYRSEKYIGVLWNADGGLECERYNSNNQDRSGTSYGNAPLNEWAHITLVYHKASTELYINGTLVTTVASTVNIAAMLGASPEIYLGKANWESGEYADMTLDSFKVFNYVLDEAAVSALYKKDMGIE